jgi:hypothetical protein
MTGADAPTPGSDAASVAGPDAAQAPGSDAGPTLGSGDAAAAGTPPAVVAWRYRRLLGLYPAHWQAANADALLGVMLDVADAEGRDRPMAREGLAVVRHASGLWAAQVRGRLERDSALRSFSVAGPAALVSGSVLAALCLVLGELAPGVPHIWWRDPSVRVFGPLPTSGTLLYAVWGLTLGAAVLGFGRVTRTALWLAVVTPALLVALGALVWLARPPLTVLIVFTTFAAVALTSPPGSLLGSARRRAGLAGVAVALAAAGGATVHDATTDGVLWGFEVPGDMLPLLADSYLGSGFYRGLGLQAVAGLAMPVVLAAIALGVVTVWRRPGWLLAAVVVGEPWLLLARVMPTPELSGMSIVRFAALTVPLVAAPLATLLLVGGCVTARTLRRPTSG